MTRISRLFGHTVFFRVAQIAMIICGMWPLKSKNIYLRIAYNTYRLVVRVELACTLILGAPITIPYALLYNKNLLSEILSYEIEYSTLFLRVWLTESKAMNLIREYLEIEKKSMASQDANTLKILEKNRKISVRLFLIYSIAIWCGLLMYGRALVYQPEVNWIEFKKTLNDTVKPELIKRKPVVYTLPYMSGKMFYVGMITQTIGVTYVVLYSVAVQAMFFALIMFTVSQIQALKHSLENFEENLWFRIDKGKFVSKEKCAHDLIKTHITTHQNIMRYVKTLDGYFKYANLIDFLFFSIHIGATCNKILIDVKKGRLSSVIFHANYLAFNYLGLHYNYRTAHEIIFESSTLATSLYKSKWYERNTKLRNIYVIMMMKMNEPLCLHVGPLYEMSNELLILIIKAGYSYFTLLSKTNK